LLQEPEAAGWLCEAGVPGVTELAWLGADVAAAPEALPRLQAREDRTRTDRTAPIRPDLPIVGAIMAFNSS
jgi:hypothetical protein